MTGDELIEYCLRKEGAYRDFPFGDGYATVKIRTSPKRNGYIFAEIFSRDGEERFTFSTSEEDAQFLRESQDGAVSRGWHCPPVQAKYKSTAVLSRLSDDIIRQIADVSYARAFAKLTEEEKRALKSGLI